jgi:BirA family biotin operon repressor/biotin-[acetyl-CoA-carboxylase] ligase
MRLAADLPIGDVVVAEEQTEGQGRHGHTWHSEKGAGLYCSIVLAPTPLLTLALGIPCDLRGPNDVMLGNQKVAGILAHLVEGKAIAGIGVNLTQTEFPPGLEATSLQLHTGRAPAPDQLLERLLLAIPNYTALPSGDILRLFTRASSYAAGRRVTVDLPGGVIHGATRGLNPDGYLIVRKDDGTDTLILAGGVRAAGA